eukprot:4665216-Pyramimonas_sp.AAC.1
MELDFKIMRLTEIIYVQCTKHGFKLNFGKTAVMLSFRGAGARTQARKFHTKEAGFLCSELYDFRVPIVRVHKVLGVRFNDGGTMSDEITERIRSSRSALRSIKKVVATCTQLDMTHK